jgi:hypothetical protein
VHAIDVGIGGDNNAVVAQVVERVFDIECVLEQVELLVLVHDFFGEAVAVEGFAAQAEHCLGIHVAGLGDRAAGGVALGDEYGTESEFFLRTFFIEVEAAVAQFFVVDIGRLGALVGQFFDVGDVFALALRLLDARAFPWLLRDFCAGNRRAPWP